jgi:death-associated protein kinase
LSIWEFSGYEPYYLVYDHFIGDPNCIHMITFSLAEAQEDQLAQLLYWFNFIKARIAPMEPIGKFC